MPGFKYKCCKSEVVMLLTNLAYAIKYRVAHDRWKSFIDIALKWKHETHYQFREELNRQLQEICRERYNLRPPNLIDVTDKRIWLALPYNNQGKMFGIQISWRSHNDFTFFASVEEEEVWVIQYARLLLKLAYDMKRLVNPIEINGQTLKIGEWLAALMFQLSGDRAGMLATLDEAEDRK